MRETASRRVLVSSNGSDVGAGLDLLRKEGVEVVDVGAVDEALLLGLRGEADAIVVELPRRPESLLDGLARIRESDPDVGVVAVLPAPPPEGLLDRLDRLGVDWVLPPACAAGVASSIRRILAYREAVLDRRRLERDLAAATEQLADLREDLEDRIRISNRALLDTLSDLKGSYQDIIYGLAVAIEARDDYTRGHCDRLSLLAKRVGERISLTPEERDQLESYSVLHDVGKIAISESILNKSGGLTAEEYEIMKTHVPIGGEIVDRVRSLHKAKPIVMQHHEWFDGNGYPNHLCREEISILARVVSVVDAYDAMTSNRSYRTSLSHTEAVGRIRKGEGTQFDPDVVRAFLEVIEPPPAGGENLAKSA